MSDERSDDHIAARATRPRSTTADSTSTGSAGVNDTASSDTAPSDTAPVAAGTVRRDLAGPAFGVRDDRQSALKREKAEFGGMRFFLAFFGWLTATGLAVLLTAVVTAILALVGVQNSTGTTTSSSATRTAGIVGIIVLAVVLFISYYVGGYVAGRMARFSGLKQGLAVWLWALIITILAAIVGAISANAAGAFSQLSTAGLPVSGATVTVGGIIALAVAVVFSLLGALLGGLGGMRFHRKVDRFAANA